jgi:hypothetical protein
MLLVVAVRLLAVALFVVGVAELLRPEVLE